MSFAGMVAKLAGRSADGRRSGQGRPNPEAPATEP